MNHQTPYGTKQELFEELGDLFAEIPEGYDPVDVADAILDALEDWIKYHKKNLESYELVRSKLRERICSA